MPSQIVFEARGFREISQRMNRAGDTVVRISLNEGLRRIGRLIVPSKGTGPLASETPKRTGKLARSTFFQIFGGINDQYLAVMQPARTEEGLFYGQFVRDGTEPHEIVARRARVLRWFDEAGNPVFRYRVHHPGTSPNPYHQRTLARLKVDIQKITNQMGKKITAYLAGR